MRLLPLALPALAILVGCSAAPTPNTPHETLNSVYRCDNGTPLRVSYDRTSDIAIVNELVSLSPAPSASGFHYRTDGHDLRGKGNEITWTAGRMTPLRCTAIS